MSFLTSSSILTLVVGVLFTRFYIKVPEGYRGVGATIWGTAYRKKGKPVIYDPGFRLTWPWIYARKISAMIMTVDLPPQAIPSASGTVFMVNGAVQCHVEDPFFALYGVEDLKTFIREQVMAQIRAAAAKIQGSEFLTKLPAQVLEEVCQITVGENSVIGISTVNLSGIEPRDKNIVNVQARTQAIRDAAVEVGLDENDQRVKLLILALASASSPTAASSAMTLARRESGDKGK